MKIKTGIGIDVHRLEPGLDFWLGGIKLEHEKGCVAHSDGDSRITTDSREVKDGDIFIALKGENHNGNTFAEKAVAQGAKHVVIDEAAYNTAPQCVLVPDTLQFLQQLANYHRRKLNIPILGITGGFIKGSFGLDDIFVTPESFQVGVPDVRDDTVVWFNNFA